MALPVEKQLQYWGIAAVVFLLLLWLLNSVILPFILGAAIAYCFDPLADRLERMGLPRVVATVVITLIALLVFLLLVLSILPLLIDQAMALVNVAPQIAQSVQGFIDARFSVALEDGSILGKSIQAVGDTIQSKGIELVESIVGSVAGLFNVLVIFVIAPVVAFYLLMDWDRMIAGIDDLLPRDHAPVIRHLSRQINSVLNAFIRGQGLVCLILGVFYSVALMAVGLQFGLIVGAIAGLLTFIPYVGALVGGVLSVGLAIFQFWGDWVWVVAVWAIFQAGQFVEGNILTPNLVGSSVGLHPVWLLFALSAFGALFGFVGLLVAVPVAAAIGVIVRWGLENYKAGLLYKGLAGRDASEE